MATEILMPALSPTMEEGKLAKWLVKEGDEVHSGDILAEIETDKATMEFEAIDDGKIAKLLVPEGAEGVKVNQPIALLQGADDAGAGSVDISAAMRSIKDALSVAAKPSNVSSRPVIAAMSGGKPLGGAADGAAKANVPSTEHKGTEHRVFASPLAKRLASDAGIDISAMTGSGPRGRVVKADVEAAAHAGIGGIGKSAAPEGIAGKAEIEGVPPLPDARLFYKPDDYSEIPHESIRKAIARRLTSATVLIPHFYLTIDCRIDRLLEARARLNAQAPKGEGAFKLSVNDFVIKACALALMRVPEVNASWTSSAILRHRHADIGVAVALDFGLITPIVFRAEAKGLAEISGEVKSLAEKARARKLKPMQYEGGTFAVSNLGMYGIKAFTAVINPPHAAILAVGAGEERAVAREGKVEAATIMTTTLSCDHRVIDGATGARFLEAFKLFVEDPATMLL